MDFKVTLKFMAGILLGLSVIVSCSDNGTNTNGDGDGDDTSTLFDTTTVTDDDGNVTRQQITVTDRGEGFGTMTLDPNFEWVLDGFVFVNEGQTLTIPAGTIIKGEAGQGENASALIVARDGTIQANGTAQAPIIFTSASDNIKPGELAGSNINPTTRGLWGGLIVLGNASLNTTSEEVQVEGIPVEEERGLYGGNDDTDNSGTLRYISIRHGGTDIGAGNEINGLTLGAVGSGTTVEFIEVIANQDDGYEWFGGTVNSKYLLSVEVGDDGIDWDQGFRGKNQFVVIYSPGGRGGEQDGGTDPEDGTPFSNPINFNVTSVGGPNQTMTFRDNSAGQYYNSIFVDYPNGVDIEDLSSGEDSKARFDAGQIILTNNIFWNVAGNNQAEFVVSVDESGTLTDLSGDQNVQFDNVDPNLDGQLIPDANVTEVTGNLKDEATVDSFFEDVDYKGALEPGAAPWYANWTLTSQAGLLQ